MSFAKEFREFALKGSVVDLAVGVIIGGAFGKIVDSLVKDIIMPVVSRIFGGLDFSNWFVLLRDPPSGYSGPMTYEALTKAGVPLFAYGNFVILAFIIFLMVRAINRLKRETPPAPPAAPPEDVLLLREIRDALVERAIEAIVRAARTGKIGDGKIFVTSVEQVVRIRTGESGEAAV